MAVGVSSSFIAIRWLSYTLLPHRQTPVLRTQNISFCLPTDDCFHCFYLWVRQTSCRPLVNVFLRVSGPLFSALQGTPCNTQI